MAPVNPDIVLSYEGGVPDKIIGDFRDTVAAEGLELVLDKRSSTRIYAGVEWLMPTAIAAYIAKPYFESFLSEAGKDHYKLLKEGLKTLARKLRTLTWISRESASTEKPDPVYSPVFSIYLDRDNSGKIKLLIPDNVSEAVMDEAMEAGLKFIEDYQWKRVEACLFADVSAPPRVGQTTLVAFDPISKAMKVIDPFNSVITSKGG